MPNAIDLFCGCGGITQGLKAAGFRVLAGVEYSSAPATVYRLNHPEVQLFEEDITKLDVKESGFEMFMGGSNGTLFLQQ